MNIMKTINKTGFTVAGIAMSVIMMSMIVFLSSCNNEVGEKTGIIVFHHEKEPSMEIRQYIEDFLESYKDEYVIEYLMITNPENHELLISLGLPTGHFPVAIAIDGKTSAMIDGELIIFAKFPDIMHHYGRHPGNWTFEHLKMVLEDNSLLLTENPSVTTVPGG